jgi:hypothetical protein
VSCGVTTVVLAGLALAGLGSAPASAATAGKDAYTTISIQAGAGLSAPAKSAMRLTAARVPLPAGHQPGAYILCELGSPLGLVSTGVNLEVEFRMACRWTDDQSLAPEIVLNELACAIQESPPNGQLYGPRRQPGTGPTGGCATAVPLAQLFGTFRGAVQAVVFLSGDPNAYYSPVYYTNSITVV